MATDMATNYRSKKKDCVFQMKWSNQCPKRWRTWFNCLNRGIGNALLYLSWPSASSFCPCICLCWYVSNFKRFWFFFQSWILAKDLGFTIQKHQELLAVVEVRESCSWNSAEQWQSFWNIKLQASDQSHLNTNASARESSCIRISLQSKNRDTDLQINPAQAVESHVSLNSPLESLPDSSFR